MSVDIKAIVQGLNGPPFNRNYTRITFDKVEGLPLLQELNDVFTEIAPDHKSDLRQEDPEEMIIRMLSLLRVLKYKPPSMNGFKEGLVQGSKEVVYPILQWTLASLPALKQRAYLANFLMKIEVPPEIMQNDQVAETYRHYDEMVEQFKEVHKEVEGLRNSGFSAGEIKNDIASMEKEKEQLVKRVERMRQKFEGVRNYAAMLSAAKDLRKEHEREEDLQRQREDQTTQLALAEEKLQRTLDALRETRANAISGGVDGLIARVEEEARMHRYICNDKLPAAIEEREKVFKELQRVLDEPAMTEGDLDQLHKEIQSLTGKINAIIEKRMAAANGSDDKLAVFKQQAAIIARKKESVAEKLQELKEENARLDAALQGKKKSGRDGPRMLKADEFMKYVAKLRTKGTTYKERKAELGALRSEYLILARTEEILQARDDSTKQGLSSLEAKKGITGFQDAQESLEKVSAAKSELDEMKGKTLADISTMVEQLNTTINAKKTSLAPLIKDLRNLRTQAQELETKHSEKKEAYDKMAASLEAGNTRLEADVKTLREELIAEESRYHYMQVMLKKIQVEQERVSQEMQAYVDRKKSLRDVYTKRVQEQENLGKHLREKQKTVKESHEPNMKQLDMWRDLSKLLELKNGNSESKQSTTPTIPREDEDRLVL